MRKYPLIQGHIYHVFTKSIAGYRIFRNNNDYKRFLESLFFYRFSNPPVRFSDYVILKDKDKFFKKYLVERDIIVDIIAYCLMPTHLHFILVPLKDNAISEYMRLLLDSYTRYFNQKNKRKGPLWQGRFKASLVETDEQLLHITRYIHLNPVTDRLVEKLEDWQFSSYSEYIGKTLVRLCNFEKYLKLDSREYTEFVNNQIDYQRALKFFRTS